MLPPLPGRMVGSIVPTDWFLRPGAAGVSAVFPLVDSNLISGPLGPSWGCHHCLAARVTTPLVLRLSGGPCPCLSWRAQPNVFWPDYSLRLGLRCGRRPLTQTPSRLGPYQGTVSQPRPPLTDHILCQPTQHQSLTPLLSLIICLLGLPDDRRRTPQAP